MTELWARLAADDGQQADEALQRLEKAPAQAVERVRKSVKPVAPVPAQKIASLLTDLEDERFEVRKRATDALSKIGEQAEAPLRKRLAEKPPLEVRQRIQPLLDRLAGFVTDPEQVRALRAVELLERIGTPEAQSLLKDLAKGAEGARLTVEAQGALKRLTPGAITRE
jgi:HEAT repeat protein